MNLREATLEGAQAAARLHVRLGTRQKLEASGGCVDVFSAIVKSKATLVFRPLENLLGFCIRGDVNPGVVISTQRPLRIQRFTGAHELGHIELEHALSLDGPEILGQNGSVRNEMEVAANSFASAFLLPKWLLQLHARRQRWNRASMADPHSVYQLSLRVGASFEATCVALERHEIIDSALRKKLTSKPRRSIKSEILGGLRLDNYFPDVWLLTERDEGLSIEGQPDDVFVLKLSEKGSAGYLWNANALIENGFAILEDRREIPAPEKAIGAPVTRALTARRNEPSSGTFMLELKQPWQELGAPAQQLRISYDLFGKEVGMPRAVRRSLMAA